MVMEEDVRIMEKVREEIVHHKKYFISACVDYSRSDAIYCAIRSCYQNIVLSFS